MRQRLFFRQIGVLTATCIYSTSYGLTAMAADIQQRRSVSMLEEVVVTARKREESLQDTPISIAAFSGGGLEARGVTRIDGIADFTPNLTFQNNPGFSGSSNNAAIFIRGIGQSDFVPTAEPGVGLYLDGVYVARSVGGLLDLGDVERIEVLRGPQGTLFGRNTIGGAVSIVSKRPATEFGGFVSTTAGTDNRLDLKATIDLPLSDTVLTKLSIASLEQDGYVERSDSLDLGDQDRLVGRLAIEWAPSDRFTATFTVDGSRSRENGPPLSLLGIAYESQIFQPVDENGNFDPSRLNIPIDAPADNFALLNNYLATFLGGQDCLGLVPGQSIDPAGNPENPACYNSQYVTGSDGRNFGTGSSFSNSDVWGTSLTLDWDLGDVALKSITGYRSLDSTFKRDGDHSPLFIVQYSDDYEQDQFSQEFQLTGDAFESNMQWILGIYYFEESGNDFNDIAFLPADIVSGGKISNDAWAIFGQATYDITDRLALTAGVRFTREEKEFLPNQYIINDRTLTVSPDGSLGPVFGDGAPILPKVKAEIDINEWTPLINLAYQWSDDFMTYASYSEGFKSGGFTQRIFPPLPTPPSHDPEFVEVYELGFKFTGFENRVRLNGAVFLTDYTDLQVQVFSGIAPVTRNAADASVSGMELEFSLSPTENWLLEGGVGYLDTDYDGFDAGEVFAATPTVGIEPDDAFEKVSQWTLNAGLTREFFLASGSYLGLRVDWTYRSEFANDSFNTPEIASDGYQVWNANINWRSPTECYSVTAGVNNIADEKYLAVGVFPVGFGQYEGIFDRGREVYLTAKYQF